MGKCLVQRLANLVAVYSPEPVLTKCYMLIEQGDIPSNYTKGSTLVPTRDPTSIHKYKFEILATFVAIL
jgi:hypothetical protein